MFYRIAQNSLISYFCRMWSFATIAPRVPRLFFDNPLLVEKNYARRYMHTLFRVAAV